MHEVAHRAGRGRCAPPGPLNCEYQKSIRVPLHCDRRALRARARPGLPHRVGADAVPQAGARLGMVAARAGSAHAAAHLTKRLRKHTLRPRHRPWRLSSISIPARSTMGSLGHPCDRTSCTRRDSISFTPPREHNQRERAMAGRRWPLESFCARCRTRKSARANTTESVNRLLEAGFLREQVAWRALAWKD